MKRKIFEKLEVSSDWTKELVNTPRGYTIIENLLDWVGKVNGMVDHMNVWEDFLDNFVTNFNLEAQEEIRAKLEQWRTDGTLDSIINQGILNSKADKTEVEAIKKDIQATSNQLKGITVSELKKPIYVAHRGGREVYPEMSMEAYRGMVASGIQVIEMDVRMLADGSLACIHDEDMSRTTDKAGSVVNFTTMGFKSARIDTLPKFTGEPVLMEDLFREFGNRVVYMPEVKDTDDNTAIKLADLVVKYNLEKNVIIQSFSAPNLPYAMERGIEVLYLRTNGEMEPEVIKGWGFNYVGLSKDNVTDLYIQQCMAVGLKVMIYTVNRRHERWKYNALGVEGFFSDDPIYLAEMFQTKKTDPFNQQVFTHGMQGAGKTADYTGGDRGTFVSPNKFGWTTESNLSDFTMQGWAGELPNNFTLELKVDLVDETSEVRWASVAFCTPTDFWNDYNQGSRGYHALIRESGNIDLYIRDDNGSTQIANMTTEDIVQGDTVTLQIQVTNTQIKVTRLDTGHTMTANNEKYRGGYLHFGRRFTGALFHDVKFI